MLAYEPSDRIKPEEALEHPFINEQTTTVNPAAASTSPMATTPR